MSEGTKHFIFTVECDVEVADETLATKRELNNFLDAIVGDVIVQVIEPGDHARAVVDALPAGRYIRGPFNVVASYVPENEAGESERVRTLRRQLSEQRRWIVEHGGTLAGYIANYGTPGYGSPCYGDGGEAIFRADTDALEAIRSELAMLTGGAL